MVKLVLAETQPYFRAELAAWLSGQEEIRLLAELPSPHELLHWLDTTQDLPQVLLIGLDCCTLPVLRLVEQLCLHYPSLRLLALSHYDDSPLVNAWRAAGGHGFLRCDQSLEALLPAVRCLAAGGLSFLGDAE
jgi:DNA-binding NarL/FixJ family response regulator